MKTQLMSTLQFVAMLESLPASCVIEAVEHISPRVSTGIARMVLLNLEESGVVLWKRELPQSIELTKKGLGLLAEFREAPST